ncbi:MAG: 4'-phosphopantetheinyl transferase family protein, partial [Chloroflexota bacterium]
LDVRFNVSHSAELAIVAVARGRDVGVDVERLRGDLEVEQLAARYFSTEEAAAIRAAPPAVRHRRFFACWTRKEAFVKARGQGLSLAFDQFTVSVEPDAPAALLRTRWDAREAGRWALRDLAAGGGYAAAIAVEGGGWQLHCWQWPADAPSLRAPRTTDR